MNRDERLIFKQYMSEGHPPEMLLDRVGPVMLLRLAIEIVYEEVAMYKTILVLALRMANNYS